MPNPVDDEVVPAGFTEADLRLGKKAVRYTRTLCLLAFVACIVMDVFLFMHFPANTPHPGTMKHGAHPPLWLVFVMPLILILMIWRPWKKAKDDHHMRWGSRTVLYIIASIWVLWVLWMQVAMIEELLFSRGLISHWWGP